MATQKRTILVVDDDRMAVRQVSEILDHMKYHIDTAKNGVEAIEKVRAHPPDLLLLDVVMPKMNGLEVCRIVKSLSGDVFIPVIMVTVKSDIESKVIGLKQGADDYLAKPFNPMELRARVESMMRIKLLQDQLTIKKRELEDLSITDDLTGLFNHRAMQQRLRDEFKRAQRYNEPLSILLIDADNFQSLNDQHGHQFGDVVIRDLARLFTDAVRQIDLVARYGGEEFLIILPQTHFTGSLTVADRIWRSVGAHVFSDGKTKHRLTLSVGVSFYPNKNVTTADQLITHANEALQQAKREGRDRICLSQYLDYMYRPQENL